jgi:hypothetical protein
LSDSWTEQGSTEHSQLQKIRSLLAGGLTAPPVGKVIAKITASYSGGNLSTLVYKDASDMTLFTLTFSWNSDGSWAGVVRS